MGRQVFQNFDIGLYGLFTNTEDVSHGWTINLADNFALLSCNYHPVFLPNIYAGEAETTIENDNVDIDISFNETSFTNFVVFAKLLF